MLRVISTTAYVFIIITLITTLFPKVAYNQEPIKIANEGGSLYVYIENIQITEKIRFHTTLFEIHSLEPLSQKAFFFSPSADYSFGKGWSIGAGLRFMLITPGLSSVNSNLSTSEWFSRTNINLNPYIVISQQSHFKRVLIEHRFMSEAFIENKRDAFGSLTSFKYGRVQLRYRFQVVVPIYKFNEGKQALSFICSEEFFLTAFQSKVNTLFDQNRFYVALGVNPAPNMMCQIGYMNQFMQIPNTTKFNSNHLLTFVFVHNLRLQKAQKKVE